MGRTATINIQYTAGHTNLETWEKTDYFCPYCGQDAVWDQVDAGDYYLGTTLTCTNCGVTFHLPCSGASQDYENQQRVRQLKDADRGGAS